jgi:predicted Zn-ribbon and HTH transcriptional regulator
MTTLSELRVCKLCGNVFSKKAGVVIISSCPQCHGTSLESITTNENPDEVYLDELD